MGRGCARAVGAHGVGDEEVVECLFEYRRTYQSLQYVIGPCRDGVFTGKANNNLVRSWRLSIQELVEFGVRQTERLLRKKRSRPLGSAIRQGHHVAPELIAAHMGLSRGRPRTRKQRPAQRQGRPRGQPKQIIDAPWPAEPQGQGRWQAGEGS